ncbi:MAG: hypothetical protein JO358_12680 [Alphaproteobacteria bacterium]|nr:hypothetical protein [Alphaproteobacteria bacterium]
MHAAAAAPARAAAGVFSLPHASIALDRHSLSDWPKPASLLPQLIASPGAVEFGEVYLSWSERGLALATIGQDYFEPDLLAYDGPFPMADAYRVELGVDFGTGPKRFTLFFIPPRTKVHDHPPMRAQLCAGSAAFAIAAGCAPVSGAEAVYFGADQPRITAEMLIPWSTLGITSPAPGTALRAEVAVTSWDGERWMSLSGRAPTVAMEHPETWHPMRLGNTRQIIERVLPLPVLAPG